MTLYNLSLIITKCGTVTTESDHYLVTFHDEISHRGNTGAGKMPPGGSAGFSPPGLCQTTLHHQQARRTFGMSLSVLTAHPPALLLSY